MTMNQQETFKQFDNVFEPLIIVDENKKIMYYNHTFSTFTQVPPRILNKTDSLNELLKSSPPQINNFLDDSLKKNDISISEELELIFEISEKVDYIAVIKVIPLHDDNANLFMICFNDLSVEKKLYDKYKLQVEKLKESHSQIIHADKLVTLGELTAGISHEISNPLTIASCNADLIRTCIQRYGLAEKIDTIKSSLTDLISAHSRISEIIHGMKGYLHKSEDKKEYCQLEDIINTSIKMVMPSFKEKMITVTKNIITKDAVALISRIRIEQVLINLLKNALQAIDSASTKNGEVVVTLKQEDDGFLSVCVSDNGPGIPDDIKELIFEAFFTTKKIGEGTGMGLSLSSKMMNANQGSLSVQNNKNCGATFEMKLPAIEVSSYIQNDLFNTNFFDDSTEGKKILVLDNEAQVLNILSKIFEAEGYIFVGSVTGVNALKLMEEIDFDLIITDYDMPNMNGTEFSKRVRSNGIKCPILYLTSLSYVDHFTSDKEEHNISGVILKPFTKEEVIKTISHALGENS